MILGTDSCAGIRNCRDDNHGSIKHFDQTTVEEDERKDIAVPTAGVPFLPVETGDNVNNNGANNNDNVGANDEDEVMTEEPSIETTVEITTEMTTETSTEQETTADMMVIVPYRTRDQDEDGNTSTSVTIYRR